MIKAKAAQGVLPNYSNFTERLSRGSPTKSEHFGYTQVEQNRVHTRIPGSWDFLVFPISMCFVFVSMSMSMFNVNCVFHDTYPSQYSILDVVNRWYIGETLSYTFISVATIPHCLTIFSTVKTKRHANTPQRGTALPCIGAFRNNPPCQGQVDSSRDSHQEVETSWYARVYPKDSDFIQILYISFFFICDNLVNPAKQILFHSLKFLLQEGKNK
jgi:hypothetical protein